MNKLESELKQGAIWAKMPPYKRLERDTLRSVEKMLSECPDSYVSNSWGKQSVVMAHLVWRVNSAVPNVHFTGDDAGLIADFSNVKRTFLARFSVTYIERVRALKLRDAIRQYNEETNPQGVFVGLCAYESKGRTKTIESSRDSILVMKHDPIRCTPLGWWKQEDLAAYIAKYDIPLLDTYHRFGLEARTSTGAKFGSFTERALDYLPSSRAAKLRANMEAKRNEP